MRIKLKANITLIAQENYSAWVEFPYASQKIKKKFINAFL
jgi:hypothetical protein